MGQAYKNDDIRTAIKDTCKLDGYSDKVPSDISKDIQLSVDVNPFKNKKVDVIFSAFNSNTHTLLSDKDFYVTNILFSDAIAGTTGLSADTITGVINGQTVNLAILSLQTGTLTDSQNATVSLNFQNNPIKLDVGSTITITIENGNLGSYAIYGYYVDPNIYDTGKERIINQ